MKLDDEDIVCTGLQIGFAIAVYVGAASLGMLVPLALGYAVIAITTIAIAVEVLMK